MLLLLLHFPIFLFFSGTYGFISQLLQPLKLKNTNTSRHGEATIQMYLTPGIGNLITSSLVVISLVDLFPMPLPKKCEFTDYAFIADSVVKSKLSANPKEKSIFRVWLKCINQTTSVFFFAFLSINDK